MEDYDNLCIVCQENPIEDGSEMCNDCAFYAVDDE